MNKAQRSRVRESLIERGFERSGATDDLTGLGAYTETWTHPDGTTTEVKWSVRRSVTHLLIETGRASSLAACDEPFANGEPGSHDITEVDCGVCLALFPHRPR
jgi:hypothetical protein